MFSVEELTNLMSLAKPDVIPALAIGAFAGLRSEEIKRLDWADFKWEDGEIEIRAAITKTRIRRLVTMCDSLKLWLMPHKQSSGPVFPYQNLCNQFLKLATKAGVKWKRNVLRHSAISYRVASWKSIAEVAQEAGNSANMIQRHYLRVVNRKQADAWFALTPDAVEVWRKSQSGTNPVPPPANGNMENEDILHCVLNGDDANAHTSESGRTGCRSGRKPVAGTHEGRSSLIFPGHQTNDHRLDAPTGPAASENFAANAAIQNGRH